ncbi:MAG TPA: c-type cytochrome [Rhizomicrobium sp.]|jgi:cytochrome c oxidase cbb3-type subunit 3|nr:c-type cytochrome [Rhizomicrobium sp.]
MKSLNGIVAAIVVLIVAVVAVGLYRVIAPGKGPGAHLTTAYNGIIPAEKLLRVPVSGVYPGGTASGLAPDMKNPLADDPDAVARGMKDFDTFNCSGCHMANGGGGMGPALSNHKWIYRASPANIYLDIVQGRSAGMPAFGAMLPDRTVWELVAYVQSLSEAPLKGFGTTTPAPQPIEQVAAGRTQSPTPWKFTEPMPPEGKKPGTSPQNYQPAAPTPFPATPPTGTIVASTPAANNGP